MLVLLGLLALLLVPAMPAEAVTAPTFVQVAASRITSGTVNTRAFSSANTAGDLIVVYAV